MKGVFGLACSILLPLEFPMNREIDEDVLHDEAVQAEVDMEIPCDAAKALYRAAKIALARGGLEAITEHMLRDAVKKSEAL